MVRLAMTMVVGTGVLLAGCGGNHSGPTAATAASTPPPSAAAPATPHATTTSPAPLNGSERSALRQVKASYVGSTWSLRRLRVGPSEGGDWVAVADLRNVTSAPAQGALQLRVSRGGRRVATLTGVASSTPAGAVVHVGLHAGTAYVAGTYRYRLTGSYAF